jgi:hypothetical protein
LIFYLYHPCRPRPLRWPTSPLWANRPSQLLPPPTEQSRRCHRRYRPHVAIMAASDNLRCRGKDVVSPPPSLSHQMVHSLFVSPLHFLVTGGIESLLHRRPLKAPRRLCLHLTPIKGCLGRTSPHLTPHCSPCLISCIRVCSHHKPSAATTFLHHLAASLPTSLR